MPPLDVAGFNQFKKEILVIDANMNSVIDPEDPAIALDLAGHARGERVEFEHPRYLELRRIYEKSLEKT
jgi:hypothetical protein